MWKLLLLGLFLVNSLSCGNKQKSNDVNDTNATKSVSQALPALADFVSPQKDAIVKLGDVIDISYQLKDSVDIDTAVLFVNNREVARFVGESYKWTMNDATVGNKALSLSLRFRGVEKTRISSSVKYLPPAPKYYTYKLVKTYPHNELLFTQGLFYHDGYLFEGTGSYGESALLKIKPETGKAEKSVQLANEYFGEGITLFKDKIYQLTWQQRKCFVYNKETMNEIGSLPYTGEGWGLATIDDLMVFSDGSPTLHFVDPASFAEVKQLQVCNNKGFVTNLNELEYIDGLLWANVWTENIIVMIDPKTGAVVGEIDFSGIYPKANTEECLNGIAYDAQNKRIFVTGKRWSKLFEVQIVLL